MFKIYDGRSQFYQWDIDRKVVVNDNSINQVHFCNRTDDCSLICEVYDLDGLRVADVPNILLQDNWRINVYAYDHNYTKHCDVFEVVKRSKPADYVYTETEILNFDTIMERLDGIKENIGEEVQKYLEENDITVDLTGYATETYVDEAVAAIKVEGGGGLDYYDFSKEMPAMPISEGSVVALEEIYQRIINGDYAFICTNKYTPYTFFLKDGTALKMTRQGTSTAMAYEITFNFSGDGKLTTTAWPVEKDILINTYYVDVAAGASPTGQKSNLMETLIYMKNNYQTATQVETAISTALGDIELTNYYTKTEIDDLLANMPAGDIPSGEEVEF